MSKNKHVLHFKETAIVIISAVLASLAMHVFVFPANFSPIGVDGIATMVQSVTGFNAGYTSMLINIPLLIAAWFYLNRKYVIYTLIYILVFSALLVIFKEIDFYHYTASTDRLIPAVFSGIILGFTIGHLIRVGGSAGGVVIIAGIIQKKRPYKNVESLISVISYVIIAVSFFVYNDLTSILLSVVQIFVSERMVNGILKSSRSAVEFKIITKDVETIKTDILRVLRHGATFIETKGMFTDTPNTMIMCVVNTYQIADFMKVIKSHKDTFAVFSDINGVIGNFRWNKYEDPK